LHTIYLQKSVSASAQLGEDEAPLKLQLSIEGCRPPEQVAQCLFGEARDFDQREAMFRHGWF